MKLMVYNDPGKGVMGFGKKQGEVLGECSITVPSLTNVCDRPQYYNLINPEGMFVGQVLANFHIEFYPKDPKKRDEKIDDSDRHKELVEMFKKLTRDRCKVNLSFSLFAIRNLAQKAIKPIVTVKLTLDENDTDPQDLKFTKVIKLVKDEGDLEDGEEIGVPDPSHHPNFCQKVSFENVPLREEPLLWPFLQITVSDEEKGFMRKGCETCYTTISLIQFAGDILSFEEMKYATL